MRATYTGNRSEARDLVFFCQVFKGAHVPDVRALVENEFFYDTYGDFIEGLKECGASDSKVICQADNQAHFLNTDSNDNLSVCRHVANVVTTEANPLNYKKDSVEYGERKAKRHYKYKKRETLKRKAKQKTMI